MSTSRIAAVQVASGPRVCANLTTVGQLIDKAVEQAAELIVLPENFAFMGKSYLDLVKVGEPYRAGPIQAFLAAKAKQHRVWIVGGTVPIVAEHPDKVRAATILYDCDGEAVARYDKIHLFDVTVHGKDVEHYRESDAFEPGDEVVVADTPFGRLGLAACYDLRFPELFRAMVVEGIDLIALPCAFTAVTGRAHWESLVRARAIENLSYVVAACQGGYHISGRETHGDSMIVDPWGTVLQRQPKGPGVITQEVDRQRIARLRGTFPAIDHIKLVCGHHEQRLRASKEPDPLPRGTG